MDQEWSLLKLNKVYPFVHINHAPGMELVNKLTQTASGHTRTQQFKYKGAVSHAEGLGFMGFMAVARSNLYGDNVTALWNITKMDPQLRGAPFQQWTSEVYAFDETCYINKTVTKYHTELMANNVFVFLPRDVATHNTINDSFHEQSMDYDAYYNIETLEEKSEDHSKTTQYTYWNNSDPTDQNYHVGRLKTVTETTQSLGSEDFVTEQEYTYLNNVLSFKTTCE